MAEEMVISYSDTPLSEADKADDFKEHARTYDGFMQWTKWCVLGTIAILVVLYLVFVL